MDIKYPKKQLLAESINANRHLNNTIYAFEYIDQKAYTGLLRQREHERNEEQNIENSFIRFKQEQEQRDRVEMREEQLAAELNRQNRLRTRDEKMRQQIRESNQEIKELQSKLRAAYVGKGLHAQFKEKEAQRLKEKLILQKEQKEMEERIIVNQEFIRQNKLKELNDRFKLREELLQQMEIKRQKNKYLYENFLEEKKYLDDLIQQIKEERLADLEKKLKNREILRNGLGEFQKSQKIWQEKERREIEEENQRIVEFLEEREKRLIEGKGQVEEKRKQKDRIVDKICADIQAITKKAEERRDLLQMLEVEEIQEKIEKRDRAELEKKIRSRIDVRMKIDEQKRDHIARQLQAQEEDRQFRLEQMKELAEKDRIDQLTAEKKRQKMAEHYRTVQIIMENRKKQQEIDLMEKLDERQADAEEQERIEKLIEEERIKILKEHAAELVGFFPPGVLRESDKKILNI